MNVRIATIANDNVSILWYTRMKKTKLYICCDRSLSNFETCEFEYIVDVIYCFTPERDDGRYVFDTHGSRRVANGNTPFFWKRGD